jgi:hypothetical protein
MALPLLSLTFADSFGRTTTKLFEMKNEVLHADQVLDAQGIIAELANVTDLGVIRADIIYRGVDEGFAPTAGSNIDVGATFSGYIVDGNGKKASLKVPGIKLSLVDSDGTVPITGAVETFLNDFEDGMVLYLSDGEQIDTWIKGALDK